MTRPRRAALRYFHLALVLLLLVLVVAGFWPSYYGKVLTGRADPGSRSRRVIDVISGPYGNAPVAEALGQLYVEKMFPASSKERALRMVQNIKDALADRLKTAS